MKTAARRRQLESGMRRWRGSGAQIIQWRIEAVQQIERLGGTRPS